VITLPERRALPFNVSAIFREGIGQRRLDSCVLRSFEEVSLLIAVTAFDLDTVKLLMNIFVSLSVYHQPVTHVLTSYQDENRSGDISFAEVSSAHS
jgi:hypothetical protein